MDAPWTLAVLRTGAENLIPLGSGREATHAAAFDAAIDALAECAAALGKAGRQEYRITVAGALTIITPGLTEEGLVDFVALNEWAYRQYAAENDHGLRTT